MNSEETDIFTAVGGWIERNRSFTKDTQATYRRVISDFVKWLPEGIEKIGQLQNIFIEDYIQSINDRFTPKTIRRYRQSLRTFYHYLSKQFGIDDVVPDAWPKPKFRKLPILKAGETNVVAEWFCYCKRYAPTTQQYYHRVMARLIEFLGIETIDQLSCRAIEKYISNEISKGSKKSYANIQLNAIKSFCRWLSRSYEVPNCTIGIQMLRTDPTEPRVLTWEEYQKILSVCNGQEEGDIARFLANTGVRCSELVSLRWANVSKDFKMLTVIGKGHKKRYVPLNDVCRDILQRYEQAPDDTFLHFMRRCTNRKTLYNICVKLAKRAGIPVAGPHSYRHLFATELLRRGVPISHVSKLLGHSSIAITEKAYIHFQPDFLNGITDVLCKGVAL